MNQFTDSPMPEAEIRRTLLAYLSENGPTRSKSLSKRAGTPYERSMKVLDALRGEGVVVQVPGGSHRGIPAFAWKLVGDSRAGTSVSGASGVRFTFSAQATLAAMQSAARDILMGRMA